MNFFIEEFIVFLFMVGAMALSVIAEVLFGGLSGSKAETLGNL